LAGAVNSLNQATQALTATATQMMQIMHTLTGGAGIGQAAPGAGPAVQINIWEDDPFSEAVVTQNPPLATPFQSGRRKSWFAALHPFAQSCCLWPRRTT
jgi:hypothetical protein